MKTVHAKLKNQFSAIHLIPSTFETNTKCKKKPLFIGSHFRTSMWRIAEFLAINNFRSEMYRTTCYSDSDPEESFLLSSGKKKVLDRSKMQQPLGNFKNEKPPWRNVRLRKFCFCTLRRDSPLNLYVIQYKTAF